MLAGNANKALTTESATTHAQGRPSIAMPHNGWLCNGWPPLLAHCGTSSGFGFYLHFQLTWSLPKVLRSHNVYSKE